MMRITKKTDPLFKPLKKLKNALEVINNKYRVLVMIKFQLNQPKQ